jgi:RNA polymerase sigma-70 factor (ECF subfamily)
VGENFGTAFRAFAPEALRAAAESPDVLRALGDLVARGAAAWPALPLDGSALVAQAARYLPSTLSTADLAKDLLALHAGDLHLACACALGSPAAMLAFERDVLAAGWLRAALTRIDSSPHFSDEVRQSVLEKLLLARAGAPPRIGQYSGRWPLTTWLRTIAVRAAVDLRRSGGAANVPSADERAAEQLTGPDNPELRYLKLRYGKELQEALGAAFATLDDEQANLLRLQLVDGLRTSQIAALFRVDRATIKRRLAACRDHLLAQTSALLREQLHLSPAEFVSLAGLVQSQLHLSLTRLLQRS